MKSMDTTIKTITDATIHVIRAAYATPVHLIGPVSRHMVRWLPIVLLVGLSTLGGGAAGGPTSFAKTAQVLPPPAVTITAPDEVLIGEPFTFQVVFDNPPANPAGYGPFLDVVLDTGGVDLGTFGGPCDGLSYIGAEMVGVNPTLDLAANNYVDVVTAACPTSTPAPPVTVNHPYGPLFGPVTVLAGATLLTIELPFGSFQPNQPPIVVAVTAMVHNFADEGTQLNPGPPTPLKVFARSGFRFGATPLDNPNSDPIVLSDTNDSTMWAQQDQVIPRVFTLDKEYLGPEDEAVAGPNFVDYYPLQYKITVNIAEGQTIHNLQIEDLLPAQLQYNLLNPNNLQVWVYGPLAHLFPAAMSPSAPCSTQPPVLLGFPVAYSTPTGGPGGSLQVSLCHAVNGLPQDPAEVVILFEFYIPDNVLKAECDNSPVTIGNKVRATGDWDPLDPRDPNPSDPPGTTVPLIEDKPGPAHKLKGKCLAIQKSVRLYNDIGAAGATPGDTLAYTLTFQVSDYHTMGNLVIEDLLADGQDLLAAPPPMITVLQDQISSIGSVGPLPFPPGDLHVSEDPTWQPPRMCPPQPGGTVMEFNLSDAMASTVATAASQPNAPRWPAGILTGGLAVAGAPTTIPAIGEIVFYAEIRDDYKYITGPGKFVDKHDPIRNCVKMSGKVYQNAAPATTLPSSVIGDSLDDSGSVIPIVNGVLTKSVIARNGQWITGSPPPYAAFDNITYEINYTTVPSGDAQSFSITDWLPLPVLRVDDPDASGGLPWPWATTVPPCAGGTPPPVGTACWVPDPPLPTPVLSQSPPGGDNSLTFTFGTFDDPSNTPHTVTVRFTLKILDQPFADGLHLTNETQECEQNTFGATFCQAAIAQFVLTEPALRIRKGVVAADNPNAVFSPAPPFYPPSNVFNPQGTCAARFTTWPFTASTIWQNNAFLSDVTGVDAGDTVSFAIVVENYGSGLYGAFNVEIEDTFPIPDMDLDPSTICVSYGDGTPVVWTHMPGSPYVAGGGFKLHLTDPNINQGALYANPNAPAPSTDPKSIAIITFNAKKLKPKTQPGCYPNKTDITHYATSAVGPNFVPFFGTPLSDVANVCVLPKLTKTIFGTSETHTAASNVTIGESVRYRLVVELPEGDWPGFEIKDRLFAAGLPAGQEYSVIPGYTRVGLIGSGSSPTVTCSLPPGAYTPGSAPISPALPFPPGSITIGGSVDTVQVITFDLGHCINADSDPDHEYVVLEFVALVRNWDAAVPGNMSLNNDLDIKRNVFEVWKQGQTTAVAISNVVDVTIVEPKLVMTKTVLPTSVIQSGSVNYSIGFTNAGNADAFDIVLEDTVPTGIAPPLAGSITVSPACIGLSKSVTGNLISVHCDGVAVNASVTVTYPAVVTAVPCPATLTNSAVLTWTSLPGPQGSLGLTPGLSGATDGERNGTVNPPAANSYTTMASVPLAVQCPNPCATLPPNMVAWYPLDEQPTDTSINDIAPPPSSMVNNAGAPLPGPAVGNQMAGVGTGQVGTALYFPNTSHYVTVPDHLELDLAKSDLTIDTWYKVGGMGTSVTVGGVTSWKAPIVDKLALAAGTWTGYAAYVETSWPDIVNPQVNDTRAVTIDLVLAYGNGGAAPTTYRRTFHTGTETYLGTGWSPLAPPFPSQWRHVAVTVNTANSPNGVAIFYLNGLPVGAPVTGVATGLNNAAAMWIGRSRLSPQGSTELYLDELEIFNDDIPAQHILDIYAALGRGKCRSDLGDAPDRTNHPGQPMLAYLPSTPANYPTVYQPLTPGPVGPIHLDINGDFWLGRAVTHEAEADQGGDQDVANNIVPAAAQANRDLSDDGIQLATLNLPHCGATAAFQYDVSASPTAPPGNRYVNVWLDWNRDGDWADQNLATLCPNPPLTLREWAVVNQVVTGAGSYTTPPFPAFSPPAAPAPGSPIWLRISITNVPIAPANADGSGPPNGYPVGETEDYLVGLGSRTVCGTKYNDANGNGVRDPGEPGLAGWQINAVGNLSAVVATATTGTSPLGQYCLTVPAPETITISEVPKPGWAQTAPGPVPPGTHTIVVPAGTSPLTGYDFGNKQTITCCWLPIVMRDALRSPPTPTPELRYTPEPATDTPSVPVTPIVTATQ